MADKEIKITVVTSVGCANCAKAKEILEKEIRPNYPEISIEYIDMLSDEGQKLIQQYGILASPGIIINDELFSAGGLNLTELKKKLTELTGSQNQS